MSRLLFAAARGARIQAHDGFINGWILSSHAPLSLSNDRRQYRIHPDDEHLQYGPISSALREMAETGRRPDSHMVWGAAQDGAERYFTAYSYDPGHRTLFLLILAEALADEGL